MTQRASGTFDIDSWDADEPYDEADGTALARIHVGKTFQGDLTGTSGTDLVTVTTPAGPTAYVGVERFVGTLGGRKGGFVLQHAAGSEDGTPERQWLRWLIVPTSGSGELAGLCGEGQIVVEKDGGHSYTLDYDLP